MPVVQISSSQELSSYISGRAAASAAASRRQCACNSCHASQQGRSAAKRGVIVMFSAKWCGPCQTIAPVFQNYANKYSNVWFLKVDCDASPQLTREQGVRGMPTFIAFRSGSTQPVAKFSGANQQELANAINKLVS